MSWRVARSNCVVMAGGGVEGLVSHSMSVFHSSSSSVLCAGASCASCVEGGWSWITGDAGAGGCGRVWDAGAELDADGAEPNRGGAVDGPDSVEDVRRPDFWGGVGAKLIMQPRTAHRRDS